ncbi:hypothetical protein PCANC_03916 [Puccinia coronata f. sp. avenae]|uniref:Uncharacterized protein n=1 Tax=Puccinia coronata f. sp. avenae TaxID=200324 RepID=A0A2N5W170_9BASI|nr:hypothetical protein PCANC_03916 [Puccinia coronata f. sp. avenae]
MPYTAGRLSILCNADALRHYLPHSSQQALPAALFPEGTTFHALPSRSYLPRSDQQALPAALCPAGATCHALPSMRYLPRSAQQALPAALCPEGATCRALPSRRCLPRSAKKPRRGGGLDSGTPKGRVQSPTRHPPHAARHVHAYNRRAHGEQACRRARQACRACTPVWKACKACTPFGQACRLCTPVAHVSLSIREAYVSRGTLIRVLRVPL